MNSTDALLDRRERCADCGVGHTVSDWLASDGDCPDCGTAHVVPRLPTALRAVERGDHDGASVAAVAERHGLDGGDVVDLLLALGCSAPAALDVARVAVEGRPRSEWRRWIDETREEEARHVAEADEVLARHGVALDYPEE